MKRVVLIVGLFLISQLEVMAMDFYSTEDPKAYLTRLRFNYNFSWDIFEIETKIAKDLSFYKGSNWSVGIMGSITMFIHPTSGLFGAYPVNDLYGAIGTFVNFYNVWVENLNISIQPIVHESSHIADGWINGISNIARDYSFDSNEYFNIDTFYLLSGWKIFGGLAYYIYLPSKPIETMTRPLRFRFHFGTDGSVEIFPGWKLLICADIGLFYEDGPLYRKGFHPAYNFATGFDLGPCLLLIHYESQQGLGQDFRILQQRLGIELVIP